MYFQISWIFPRNLHATQAAFRGSSTISITLPHTYLTYTLVFTRNVHKVFPNRACPWSPRLYGRWLGARRLATCRLWLRRHWHKLHRWNTPVRQSWTQHETLNYDSWRYPKWRSTASLQKGWSYAYHSNQYWPLQQRWKLSQTDFSQWLNTMLEIAHENFSILRIRKISLLL